MSRSTYGGLWAGRLSITAACPGTRVGTSPSRTKATNVAVSVAPSKLPQPSIPCTVNAAIVLRTFQCPCGTLQTIRLPRGPRAAGTGAGHVGGGAELVE